MWAKRCEKSVKLKREAVAEFELRDANERLTALIDELTTQALFSCSRTGRNGSQHPSSPPRLTDGS